MAVDCTTGDWGLESGDDDPGWEGNVDYVEQEEVPETACVWPGSFISIYIVQLTSIYPHHALYISLYTTNITSQPSPPILPLRTTN